MTGTVLILGAKGRFGRNAAEAFWNAGWRVTLFDRASDDLMQAARGMDVIVNGWNPAYPDWQSQLPQLTAQVIAAARASGATVILPGNVYVFGKDAPQVFGPETPQLANNPMGRLRIEMEQSYRDADIPTILLRAGDFLDTETSGNWFDRIMAPPLKRGRLSYPGALDRPHAWAFLPDMARAAVQLAEMRAALPRFADIAFPGYTLTGQELAALCGQALGRPIRARKMAWMPLRIAVPFWPLARHLLEMRYLWNKPHRMAREGFDKLLPGFKPTPEARALSCAIAPVISGETPDQPTQGDAAPRPVQAA
ncbi:Rossmann-fold NAD(P)-binding domain-containing protein [Tropicibacter oceani]|uniref:Epimerase n=1 Tax=Tropicibacter oceani TaxID=3058420 RepID=A0ABY8QJU3_9RHOB|nr:epimerase [Tropicibacter oceani]WGW04723.1 epimerase [Tropicibacter oceani]